MIADLIAGMEIIKHYNPDAPIAAVPYMAMVPAVKAGDITDPSPYAISDLTALGWLLHPVYDCYYYPGETITELADVTGEEATKVPPLPTVKPAV